MRLRCKLEIHDWQIIDSIGKEQLEENIISEINNHLTLRLIDNSHYFVKAVCLECGRIIDEITPEIERIKKEYYYRQKRRLLAEEIIERNK